MRLLKSFIISAKMTYRLSYRKGAPGIQPTIGQSRKDFGQPELK